MNVASWLTAHRVALRTLLLLPILPVFAVFPTLAAQTARAEGRVLKPDSTPVAGIRVVLHQVGRTVQGPLDSVPTDRSGRFRFAFRPDTTSLYLLSARYNAIEYFSPPVHTNPSRPDTALRIVVYDTSSTAPVSVEARHVVVARPGEDGSRNVLDLIVLQNVGDRTRIAPDTLRPSWSGAVPRGSMGLELGESDISPDAVTRRGDSVFVTAPLAPGEKQLTIQYLLPAGMEVLDLPFAQTVPMVNVLAEEKKATVSGGTLVLADSQVLQGRSFRRWSGAIPAGSSLRVVLPGRERAPEWLLGALVASVVLVLSGGGWYLMRRQSGIRPASPDDLLEAVAALDARYLGGEAETSPQEWSFYTEERARLKRLLEGSLAGRGPNR
jgi:hypothetical protein